MTVEVVFEGSLVDKAGKVLPPKAMKDALSRVMKELPLHGAASPGIAAHGKTGSVKIRVAVDVDDIGDAVAKASAQIRAAVHAAGIGTPNWEEANRPADKKKTNVRLMRERLVVA